MGEVFASRNPLKSSGNAWVQKRLKTIDRLRSSLLNSATAHLALPGYCITPGHVLLGRDVRSREDKSIWRELRMKLPCCRATWDCGRNLVGYGTRDLLHDVPRLREVIRSVLRQICELLDSKRQQQWLRLGTGDPLRSLSR